MKSEPPSPPPPCLGPPNHSCMSVNSQLKYRGTRQRSIFSLFLPRSMPLQVAATEGLAAAVSVAPSQLRPWTLTVHYLRTDLSLSLKVIPVTFFILPSFFYCYNMPRSPNPAPGMGLSIVTGLPTTLFPAVLHPETLQGDCLIVAAQYRTPSWTKTLMVAKVPKKVCHHFQKRILREKFLLGFFCFVKTSHEDLF